MSDLMIVTTWDDLGRRIAELTPEQRSKPIQCVLPGADLDKVFELLPGIAVGTVGELEVYKCRSVYDNKYHADDVVLLLDENLFSEDGAIGYHLQGTERKPIYGPGGKTSPDDQCSRINVDVDVAEFFLLIFMARMVPRWDDIHDRNEQA